MTCSAKPDINLGPGDTTPRTRITLYEPDNADGSPGDPLNLQNPNLTFKTVVFRHQIRDFTAAAVTRTCAIVQSSPTVDRGVIDIDWFVGGPVTPSGSDHRARVIVTDGTGRQETLPRGDDVELPDGTNPSFLWLQVARDFVAVP